MKQKNYFSIVRATLLALLVLLFVPSSVKGATYNFDWRYWLNAATNAYIHDSGSDTECSGSIIMSGNNYANIEGAQTVTRVQYRSYNAQTNKYSTSKMEIEERLAFVLNTNGKANEYNDGNGWYLRAEPNSNGNGYAHRALYTGSWNNKLAILSLRAGDKVTINFEGGDHVSQYGAAITISSALANCLAKANIGCSSSFFSRRLSLNCRNDSLTTGNGYSSGFISSISPCSF